MTIISEYHQCCQLSSCSISFLCTFLRTDVVIGPQWYVGWLAQINSLFFTDSSVEINADWKNGVGKFSPVQIVFQIQITLKSNSITKYKILYKTNKISYKLHAVCFKYTYFNYLYFNYFTTLSVRHTVSSSSTCRQPILSFHNSLNNIRNFGHIRSTMSNMKLLKIMLDI